MEPRRLAPTAPPVGAGDLAIDRVIAAEPSVVRALAALDTGAWRPLLGALASGALGTAAPLAFVVRLRRESPLATWIDRASDVIARHAIAIEPLADGAAARRRLRTWLTAALPAFDPELLEARLADVDEHPGHGVIARSRALLADVHARHGGEPLHRRALLVHAARCLEDALWDEALATAVQAELVAVSIAGADHFFEAARRLHAAAKLGKLELESGFELLAQVWHAPPVVLATSRRHDVLDPLDAALRRVAFLAQRITPPDDDWRAAMYGLAHALDAAHKQPLARVVRQRVLFA